MRRFVEDVPFSGGTHFDSAQRNVSNRAISHHNPCLCPWHRGEGGSDGHWRVAFDDEEATRNAGDGEDGAALRYWLVTTLVLERGRG